MKSVITLKRAVIFFIVYTMLFGLIGPKFTIWSVEDKERDGEFISNKLYEFVSGNRTDGLIQLCFDGVINGAENRLSFSIREEKLEKMKRTALGSIPLYKRDLQQGCQKIAKPNIKFAVLPAGSNNTSIMLRNRDVRAFLTRLHKATQVFFYPSTSRKGNSPFHFVIYWRDGAKEHFYHFWIRGGTQREIIVTKWDFIKAFLKDYATWPYVLILLLSGAGSH